MGIPTASSLHLSDAHTFSKRTVPALQLVAGLGVDGDAHSGPTVKHRSRVRANPDQPNLRQIHLIHGEFLDELAGKGFTVNPGDLGENVTTRGIDLLGLPTGTLLRIGDSALLAVTGLRNPCGQIESFQSGLLGECVSTDASGRIVRKTGVMAVILTGGTIHAGDPIRVAYPPEPHLPLEPV